MHIFVSGSGYKLLIRRTPKYLLYHLIDDNIATIKWPICFWPSRVMCCQTSKILPLNIPFYASVLMLLRTFITSTVKLGVSFSSSFNMKWILDSSEIVWDVKSSSDLFWIFSFDSICNWSTWNIILLCFAASVSRVIFLFKIIKRKTMNHFLGKCLQFWFCLGESVYSEKWPS